MQRDDTVSGTNPQIAQMAADSKDKQTHAIIGAAMEVRRHLGPGFRGSRLSAGARCRIRGPRRSFRERSGSAGVYKGERLPCSYRADFVCYNNVIVELKALKPITSIEDAQLLNYLKATRLERGLLVN